LQRRCHARRHLGHRACNRRCVEALKAPLAACGDDACRRAANDKLTACKEECAIANAPPRSAPDEKALAAACEAGDAQRCEGLGGLFLLGRGVAKDEARARALFTRACELDLIVACEFAGKMIRDGRGGPVDDEMATKFLTRACDGDSFGACTSLALAARKAGDQPAGVRLMTRACDGGDKLGRMGLGGMYLNGNGVKRDRARAKTLLPKACTLGAQAACDKLASW
jgi:TPR repeat protein